MVLIPYSLSLIKSIDIEEKMGKLLPTKLVIKSLFVGALSVIILITTMFSLSPLVAQLLYPFVIVPSVILLMLIYFD